MFKGTCHFDKLSFKLVIEIAIIFVLQMQHYLVDKVEYKIPDQC